MIQDRERLACNATPPLALTILADKVTVSISPSGEQSADGLLLDQQDAVARARRLIDARQYVLDSNWDRSALEADPTRWASSGFHTSAQA